MKGLRNAILWSVLAAIGLLIILSAVGAFLGAEKARRLFNCVPLAVCWLALAGLLVAGLIFFKARLLRTPAGLAMHLGSLLVLGGAMWGSEAAHDLRREWFGSTKIPSGHMLLYQGESDTRLFDRDSEHVRGRLPFTVGLREFSIDYYPTDEPWDLVLAAPVTDDAGHMVDERQMRLSREPGAQASVPGTGVVVEFVQYLPRAAPVYDPARKAVLEISPAEGEAVTLPAEVGREADAGSPPIHVRITRVFQNLRLSGMGEGRVAVDLPGTGWNPAVEVEVSRPDAPPRRRYALARMPMHGWIDKSLNLRYVVPEPIGARADPSGVLPAAEVLIKSGAGDRRAWLIPHPGDRLAGISLKDVHTPEAGPPGDPDEPEGPELFLAEPRGPVKSFKSDVAVFGDSGTPPLAEAVIEVNAPMHYGGYHFYQVDYDHHGEAYTILSVVSDSGLLAVWAGFFLVVAGCFGRMWGRLVGVSRGEHVQNDQ